MSAPETIVCRPTRWFLIRAFAMLAMFGVFTVWFLYDAEVGYRSKNEAFFTERAFHQAVADFNRLNADGDLTAEAWREFAEQQHIRFPDEPAILPRGLQQPVPWPDILHDFDKVRPLNPRTVWIEHTGLLGMSDKVPEEYYTPRKIHEQWVVFWICLALTLVTLFFLVRTLRRKIVADADAITAANGVRIAYDDLTMLDLRKWDTKGIAFAEYDSPSGRGRIRLDGLSYGGFRQEDGQPAEQMMDKLRENFSGEILEYTTGLSDDVEPSEDKSLRHENQSHPDEKSPDADPSGEEPKNS